MDETSEVVLTGIAGNYVLRASVDAMLATLATIQELVSWHIDTEADPSNQSPEDMTAHINGLVWQLCRQHTNLLAPMEQ